MQHDAMEHHMHHDMKGAVATMKTPTLMKTTKTTRRILGAGIGLAAAVVLLAVALTLPTPEAGALAPCRCPQFVQETPMASGEGDTCAQAEAALYDTLVGMTGCNPGDLCFSDLVITMECMTNPQNGQKWVGGKLRYKCLICLDEPTLR
jgi:hypothetical protein